MRPVFGGVLALVLLGGAPSARAQEEDLKALERELGEAQKAFETARAAYQKLLQAKLNLLRTQTAALEGELKKLQAEVAPEAAPAIASPPLAPEEKPAQKLTLGAKDVHLDLGDQASLSLKLDGQKVTADQLKQHRLETRADPPKVGGVEVASTVSKDAGGIEVQAPARLEGGVDAFSSTVTVGLRNEKGLVGQAPLNVHYSRPPGGDWESRAIMGFHQAGASSAPSSQRVFFDFYIARALGNHRHLYDARWSLWGNVRVASSPRQLNIPLSQFAAGFAGELAKTNVNELAQSAEFQSGLELRLRKWHTGDRVRTLGWVAFFGANGGFSDPLGEGRIFAIPSPESVNAAAFDGATFGETSGGAIRGTDRKAKYVGLVPPDRERFFRQYGSGFRLTTFDRAKPLAPPATYTLTFGQDQLVTSGKYRGPVLRTDVFYPLPMGNPDGSWKFLFLFGTVNMRIARAFNLAPLALENRTVCPVNASDPSNCSNFFDNDVRVVPVASARDTYRIGVGVDFVNLIKSFRAAGSPAAAAASPAEAVKGNP